MGLSAAALNRDTYSKTLHKVRDHFCMLTITNSGKQAVTDHRFRVLLASPEMCLQHPSFSALLRSQDFASTVITIVVDEAHCIEQWGTFRTQFKSIGKLCSIINPKCPILATTATAPPVVRTTIRKTLHFHSKSTFFLNLGNDRHNITHSIVKIESVSDFSALKSVHLHTPSDEPLPRSMIFVDNKKLILKMYVQLIQQFPNRRQEFNFLYSDRWPYTKRRVMDKFRQGEVNVLITTEVAGMVRKIEISSSLTQHGQGADIPNVSLVIQWMLPGDLSIWVQRAGRAGRNGQPARAILMLEPTVFELSSKTQNITSGGEAGTDLGVATVDPSSFRKSCSPEMRRYIMADDCRRKVLDEYFSNPSFMKGKSFIAIRDQIDY
jgi:superfamily II DNA helicase RecQ